MAGTQDFFSEIKSEVKDLGSKMNKLFDEVVRGKGEVGEYPVSADVYETAQEFVFLLDLPGFSKTNVSVQIRDNQLVVKGSRERADGDDIKHHVKERVFGKFERSITIPNGVVQDNVKAKFEEGVLSITLQKESIEVKEEASIEIE